MHLFAFTILRSCISGNLKRTVFFIYFTKRANLSRFFNEERLYEDDIEYHSYEEILTTPAIQPNSASPLVKHLVHTMREFVADFVRFT